MIKAPPAFKGYQYGIDPFLRKIIADIKSRINEINDDYLMLVVGETGSGKSSLVFHIMQEYLGSEASIDYVGLDRESSAAALKKANDKPLPRLFLNDEANISKRESISKYNKDMIDLYSSIRGKQIFHIWCNPSLDMVDKHFIQERIKSIVYCSNKDPNLRTYFLFRAKEIQTIYEKYDSLKIPLLKKVRHKYAFLMGWYKKYDGPIWTEYMAKKENRMDTKINEFYHRYTKITKEKLMGIYSEDAYKLLQVGKHTARMYLKRFIANGTLKEGIHYKTLITGKKKLTITGVDYLRNWGTHDNKVLQSEGTKSTVDN